MTSTADWRPVTWPLTASRLASCLRQCHSAQHVNEDAAATDHVARDIGSVSLRGIIGSPVKVDLVRLDMGYVDCDHEFLDANTYHTVLCAVSNDINDDLILTAAAVRQLVKDQCVNAPPCILDDVMGDDVSVENVKIEDSGDTICTDVNANDITDMPVNANVESGDENLPTSETGKANRETLIAEQQANKSLAICWSLAKQDRQFYC